MIILSETDRDECIDPKTYILRHLVFQLSFGCDFVNNF